MYHKQEELPEIYQLEVCPFDESRWLIKMKRFTPEMLIKLKRIYGRHYHPEIKQWSIPKTSETLAQARKYLGAGLKITIAIPEDIPERYIVAPKPPKKQKATEQAIRPPLPPEIKERIDHLKHFMEQQRYSYSTIKSYSGMIVQFLLYFEPKSWKAINESDILVYNHEAFIRRKRSYSSQNQFINAIKLFFTINRNQDIIPQDIARPRKVTKLPNVLSKEEVKKIITCTANLKHKCLLTLLYGAGLRIGEALRLEIDDIRSKENLLYIRKSKGAKDRRVPLSATMLKLLREYYLSYKPNKYIFEGQTGGQYSARSAQQLFKQSCKKAGIKIPATLHTLRHSYATHLLEQGVGLRYIQEILGHSSPKTTMIYTHVSGKRLSEVRSPLEDMDL